MIVERSEEATPAVVEAEMSHDSNAEKRIEVDTPPMRRPRRRIGV
jgi:hypothetical protein